MVTVDPHAAEICRLQFCVTAGVNCLDYFCFVDRTDGDNPKIIFFLRDIGKQHYLGKLPDVDTCFLLSQVHQPVKILGNCGALGGLTIQLLEVGVIQDSLYLDLCDEIGVGGDQVLHIDALRSCGAAGQEQDRQHH